MNLSERAAKAVIEAAIPGARMEFHSDQSHSIPAFDLVRPDGVIAAVEATSFVYREHVATHAAIRKRGHFVPRSQSRHDWFVFPSVGADIRRIRKNIDDYLAAIESDGLSRFHSFVDADSYPSVQRILDDLGIEGGGVVSWKEPGIGLGGLGWSGTVSSKHAQAAVEHETNRLDNRKKLAASGRTERHLFVHIDSSNNAAWIALRDLEPPESPPRLPVEITEVWAAANAGVESAWIVWRGTANGWQKLGLVRAA